MKKDFTSKEAKGFPIEKSGPALDSIDRRILRVLQRDCLIGNQTLADEIGLSPPACLKRVRRLRDTGVIERSVALLSPERLDYPVQTVVRVKLDRPTPRTMAAFEARMAALPRVTQCLTVAGDTDYILMVRSKSVADYQDFARSILAVAPGIRSYVSEIVLAVNKTTTEVPVDP